MQACSLRWDAILCHLLKRGANVKKTLLCISLVLATVSSTVAIIGTWFGPLSAARSEKPKNVFVTFAMCCPSRASILTGLYPHNHRVFTNEAPEGGEPGFRHLDNSTLATWLDDAGYRTALIGMYFNGYAGTYQPPGWDVWHPGGSDTLKAQRTEDFIRASAQDTAPFFAYVALHTPHPPAKPPARYADRYPNLGVPRTRDYNEKSVFDKPYWIRTAPRVSSKGKDAADKLYRNRARSLLEVDDVMERLYTTLQV